MSEKFYPVEERMLSLLYSSKVSMTIYELSKTLGMSFPTAKKYLQSLVKKGVVVEDKSISKNNPAYKFNFDLLKKSKSQRVSDQHWSQDKPAQKIIIAKKNSAKMSEGLRTADFFAGVGGIRLAFEKEGFSTVFANDMDKNCKTVYDENFSEPKMTLGDIHDLDLKSMPAFDVFLGGFPCQPFSIAGYRGGFKDAKGRGNAFFRIAEIIEAKKPRAFLLENVKNLRSHDHGRTFEKIYKTLSEDLKYYLKVAVLNSAKHGNIPQNRERIFIVGFKDKQACDRFKFPEETPLTHTFKNFLESGPVDDKYYYNDKPLYKKIVKDVNEEATVYQWRRQYVRANKKGLVPTLTANMGAGGHNVPIIKNKGIRKLTPRECFSIQGFPKNFKLPPIADSQLYHQAGNSVTVPVLQRIAKEMKHALDEE